MVLLDAARQQFPQPGLRGLGAAVDDGAQVGRQSVIERLAERSEGERHGVADLGEVGQVIP